MTTLTFLPLHQDVVMWRGDTISFAVSFAGADGTPLDVTGPWEAAFGGYGKVDVDDSEAGTGQIVVAFVDTDDVPNPSRWWLRRTDIDRTFVAGSVTFHG